MSFSGGVYTLPGPALVTGEVVSATENNQFRNDVAGAFNVTMLRNGTSTATANLPMGGYKLTGLGVATTSGDALSYGQAAVISDLTASGTVTISSGTANGVAYLNGSKVLTTGSALTFDGTTLTSGTHTIASGNLTFTGTGNRITGDFSNATFANRVMFQTSTAASNTRVGMLPNNPTGTSGPVLYSTNDPANASIFDIQVTNGTHAALISDKTGTGSYLPITLETGGSERMRIDTSGNVGIGTSSPNGAANYGWLTVNGSSGSVVSVSVGNTEYGRLVGGSSGTYVSALNSAPLVVQTTTAQPFIVQTNNTERMRIDSSGNVGIGTSSSLSRLTALGSSSTVTNGASTRNPIASIRGGNDNNRLDVYVDNSGGTAIMGFGAYNTAGSGTAMAFYTGATVAEAMRIDSSGNLLVGCTNNTRTGSVGVRIGAASTAGNISSTKAASTNADDTFQVYSTGASAYRFYVDMGGVVHATNTTISAISDQRYKENIRDLDVGLDAVMALKPRKFDWKEGKGANIKNARGFIAQEFEQVFPDLIDEWKDPAPEGEEPYKSVRQDLIPVLVKAIQELKAELDATKAEVAALKGA